MVSYLMIEKMFIIEKDFRQVEKNTILYTKVYLRVYRDVLHLLRLA